MGAPSEKRISAKKISAASNASEAPNATGASWASEAPNATGASWAQTRYLVRGLDQPGGKLPLFDEEGQAIDHRTIRSCIAHGWAQLWFENPIHPDWLVCRLTPKGRHILAGVRKSP